MEKKDIVMIILISVIVLVLASLTLPVIFKMTQTGAGNNPAQPPDVQPGQQPPQPPQPRQPSESEESKQLKTAISFINIGLMIPLFVIYAGIYRRMRSSFTLGLLAVIFALGMYAVTSNPLLVNLLGGHAEYIGGSQIVPDICTTVALIVLIRISLE